MEINFLQFLIGGHRLVIATETNVSSGVNLQGTAEWK